MAKLSDREVMQQRVAEFGNAFPKFAGGRASAMLVATEEYDPERTDSKEYALYSANVTIPRRCRLAAILEDIDYTSPVWVNAVALLVFGWKLVRPE